MPDKTPIHTLVAPWGRFGLFTFFIDAPEPAIVDTGIASTPAEGMAPALAKLGRRIEDVRWILLTHGHIDHLGGAHALWEMTGRRATVVIHEADLAYLRSRRTHVQQYLDVRAPYLNDPDGERKQTQVANKVIAGEMAADVVLHGGETLSLGGDVTVSVHNAPGHTAGSVAYVVDGQNDVFVGDAVQIHGAANGFPGYEDPDAYVRTLEKLRDDIRPQRMFIGHPFANAAGAPCPVELDAEQAQQAIRESLAIEQRVRASVTRALEAGLAQTDSPFSPFQPVAEALGYERDPTLEPSPFFTTLDGYRRRFGNTD